MMKIQNGLVAAFALATIAAVPVSANAQWGNREAQRRQDTKNEWRNIAIVSGLAGILGALNKDKTLTFAGTAGALYSLYRYEQDRKSQNRLDRARYTYFSQPYFYRDGKRYERRTVNQRGQRYYQFVCTGDDNRNWNNGRYNSNASWNRDRWDDDDRWDDRRDGRSNGWNKSKSKSKGKSRGRDRDDD